VFVSPRGDATAARRFFERAIGAPRWRPWRSRPIRRRYPLALEELLPAAWHRTQQHGNHRVEGAHGRLKAWLRPLRGRKRDPNAQVLIAGHALVQNLRRGHDGLAVEEPAIRRLAVAFDELAVAI
jgi:transposase, IS6 family